MRKYNQLPNSIQLMLEHSCQQIGEINPEKLYQNMAITLKSVSARKTAEAFNMSLSLVEFIKKEMVDTLHKT